MPRNRVLNLLIALTLVATVFSRAQGAGTRESDNRLIWRIGEFNASSGEFRSPDIDYANPSSDPVFEVGTSVNPDWLRFQPGPANGMTGARLHPFTIRFDLKDGPRGVYRLKIAILYETPRLSHLKLEINGHGGLFFFHPKLDYHAGDWEGTFVPQTSIDTKTIDMPAEWMKPGRNEFILTALDDPDTRQDTLGAIAPGHTGLSYDALELTQNPTGHYDENAFTAIVEPTIFYRRTSGLEEEVDVFAAFARIPNEGSIDINLGNSVLKKSISGREEFGEKQFRVFIPEWTGPATVSISVDGTKRQAVKTQITPAKKWTVFIIPHEHLDIGFTDYAAKVAELHSQSVDDVGKVIKDVPDFRWTLDGSWVANQYLAGRSDSAKKDFLDYVRADKIIIPPEFANQHTGNASLEGLIHIFYGRHQLASKYGLPPSDAAQTVDVPAYSWVFASTLHDAGIKYFLGASNGWRAPVMLLGKWNEHSPFYWEGPDGGRVLMWYSRAYLQMHTLFGSPWRMESVHDALPVFLQAYTRPDYAANSAIIFGSQLENTPFAKEQAEITAQWNAAYAYPRLQFATVHSAMQQIEHESGNAIPVFRGDFGPYWEDGYGSDASHTAMHRENQERILTAEKLSVLPALLAPTLRPDLSLLEDAWTNELLYDEHTWDYVGATSQPESEQSEKQLALKQSRVVEARREIDESIQRSFAQLTGMLSAKQHSIAVFNSLSWKRNGIVTADLPDGQEIIDSTTEAAVPYDILFAGRGFSLPGFGTGYKRVRFQAKDVPAMGYKLYALQPGHQSTVEQPASATNTIENRFYRLVVDDKSGTISSVFDKEMNKELVDRDSPYKFGSYLYVTGGDDIPNNSLYRFGAGLNPPKLTVHPSATGRIESVRKTPTGRMITISSSTLNTSRIRAEITLYDEEKKIDLRYDIKKDRVLNREAAYLAFPFGIDNPSFTYGNQIGWVNPAKDELAGGSREWYVARHWAAVSNAHTCISLVPIDAPLVNFGDIVRGRWPAEFSPTSGTIFSWLMNNYWGTNFPAWQGGDFTFRYSLTSGPKLDAAANERFGLEQMVPLEKTDVPSSTTLSTVLPANEGSLLQLDNPNVVISTWKVAEDGNGMILRLQELSGTPSHARLESKQWTLAGAWQSSSLEDNLAKLPVRNGSVQIALRPFQVITLRLTSFQPQ